MTEDFDLHAVSFDPITGKGGVEQPMLNLPGYEFQPDFSPDGTRVAFAYDADGGGTGTSALWVMDIVTGSAQQLTAPGSVQTYSPSWSPDSTRIAFDRSYIYVVDVATEKETKLTTRSGAHPSWSSVSANELVFTDWRGDVAKLNIITKATTELTKTPALEQFPHWR